MLTPLFFLYMEKQSNRLWKTKTIADTYKIIWNSIHSMRLLRFTASCKKNSNTHTFSVIIYMKTICVRLFIVYCCYCFLACTLDNGIISCFFFAREYMHVCAPKRDRLSVTLLHFHRQCAAENVFYWDTSNDIKTEKKAKHLFFSRLFFFEFFLSHCISFLDRCRLIAKIKSLFLVHFLHNFNSFQSKMCILIKSEWF